MTYNKKYPLSFRDFIHSIEKEKEDGTKVIEIKSSEILDAWDHYTISIGQSLDNIFNCINLINNNINDIGEITDY